MYLVAVPPAAEALLKQQVESDQKKYKGDVLRIRYDIGFDIDQNPEVNFRALLSDRVAKQDARLKKISFAVIRELFNLLQQFRHEADYSYTASFTRTGVKITVALV